MVSKGSILDVGQSNTQGCRGYLAVRNGFDVPYYMGSRSTFTLAKFGGHQGRPLAAGDILPIG